MKSNNDKMKKTTFISIFMLGLSEKPLNILWLILLTVLLSFLPSIEIYMMGNLVDQINNMVPYRHIIVVLIVYIALFYFSPQLFSNIKSIIRMSINHLLDVSMRTKILTKITRIGISNFESGELSTKASRALNSAKSGFLKQYETVIDMFASLFSLASLCLLYGIAGSGIIIICIILTIIVELLRKNLTKDDYDFDVLIGEKRRYNDELKSLIMVKEAAPELQFYEMRAKLLSLWIDGKTEIDDLECKHMLSKRKKETVLQLISHIKHLLCFTYLYILFCNDMVSVSLMITFVYAVFRISSLCSSTMGLYRTYISNRYIFSDIDGVLSFEENVIDTDTTISTPPAIEFQNVSYRYPGQSEYALSDVSMTIKPYERVVLVGKNGSGKSTAIRLILGYDKPESGKILINGCEAHLCSSALRNAATALFQDYAKYELTLRENIVISDYKTMSDAIKLNETIAWSDLESIIEKAPEKLDTDIIRGGSFSGGEWQKISFARAKYKNGVFVALDEPNSAIDAKFEMDMYKKFLDLAENSTSIVVSHRLPICQICDKIIVLDAGKVVESGTHDELVKNESGYYHSMYRAQANLYY